MTRVALPRPLTPRELQVAEWLAGGDSQARIARRLGISRRTVEFHVENAAAKIPGRALRPLARVVVWWRGGSEALLAGAT